MGAIRQDLFAIPEQEAVKILFLTLYDSLHPSTRFRVHQFLPYIPKGVRYEVRPVIPESLFRRVYGGGTRGARVLFTVMEVICRLFDVCRSWRYDVVYVQKGLSHIKYRGMLPLLMLLNRRIVFDFDDGVVFGDVSSFRRFPWRLLEDKALSGKLVSAARLVIAGNEKLKSDALEYNGRVLVIPTPVDTAYYVPNPGRYRKTDPVNIIWSGKRDGYKDLYIAAGALRELAAVRSVVVTVMADAYDPVLERILDGIPFRFQKWSVDAEKKVFAEGDIGIMPQHDTLWHRRKCAYKALLYMACGVPVVSTPIGIIPDFIMDGENGLMAGNTNEWFGKLCRLVDDVSLRRNIGMAGRSTVEEKFSLVVWGPRWVEAVMSVAAKT